jgi:hypothetical protein
MNIHLLSGKPIRRNDLITLEMSEFLVRCGFTKIQHGD